MRKTTIVAAGAAIMLATATSAQQQPAQQPQQPSTEQEQQAPTIQKINVVDMEQLPQETQAQVNEAISKRSDGDLQKLRSSIEATPQVKSALEARGMTSEQVIAASLTQDGTLTLITRKKAG